MKTIFIFLFVCFGTSLLFSQDNTNTTIEPNISEENNQKKEIVDNNPNQKTNTNKTIIPIEKIQPAERVIITNHENTQSKFSTPIRKENPEFLIPEKND